MSGSVPGVGLGQNGNTEESPSSCNSILCNPGPLRKSSALPFPFETLVTHSQCSPLPTLLHLTPRPGTQRGLQTPPLSMVPSDSCRWMPVGPWLSAPSDTQKPALFLLGGISAYYVKRLDPLPAGVASVFKYYLFSRPSSTLCCLWCYVLCTESAAGASPCSRLQLLLSELFVQHSAVHGLLLLVTFSFKASVSPQVACQLLPGRTEASFSLFPAQHSEC